MTRRDMLKGVLGVLGAVIATPIEHVLGQGVIPARYDPREIRWVPLGSGWEGWFCGDKNAVSVFAEEFLIVWNSGDVDV